MLVTSGKGLEVRLHSLAMTGRARRSWCVSGYHARLSDAPLPGGQGLADDPEPVSKLYRSPWKRLEGSEKGRPLRVLVLVSVLTTNLSGSFLCLEIMDLIIIIYFCECGIHVQQ